MPYGIVVTARPFDVFNQTDYYSFPDGGSAANPAVAYGQIVAEIWEQKIT